MFPFGAMVCRNSSPTIARCILTENHAGGVPSKGGAIYFWNSASALEDCLLSANTAHEGGAIYAESSNLTLRNCTLAANQGSSSGGGLFQLQGAVQLFNSVLWDNSADQGAQIVLGGTATLSVGYSDVMGGAVDIVIGDQAELIWGPGNIDADPLFADSANGDYRLMAGSPCIDAGDPDFIADPQETDIDADPRVVDGNGDGTAVVDMGADEFVPCAGDLNIDGAIDAADLALLLGSWGQCPGCPADLNDDGAVNAGDLAILLGVWGPCP